MNHRELVALLRRRCAKKEELTKAQIDLVLREFFGILEDGILDGERVLLGRICSLKQVEHKERAGYWSGDKYVPPQPAQARIKCKILAPMKRKLKTMTAKKHEEGMEKYGVHTNASTEDDVQQKTAAEQRAPACHCGRVAELRAGQWACPVHGTATFER